MDDSTTNIKNENIICKYLNDNIKKYDLIVVNDYGHGLITDKIVKNLNKKNNFLAVNAQINAGNFGYNLITKYTKCKCGYVSSYDVQTIAAPSDMIEVYEAELSFVGVEIFLSQSVFRRLTI